MVWSAPDVFIVRLRWRPKGASEQQEMFQVLRFGDGQVVEMADYRTLGPASKTAKRFAA